MRAAVHAARQQLQLDTSAAQPSFPVATPPAIPAINVAINRTPEVRHVWSSLCPACVVAADSALGQLHQGAGCCCCTHQIRAKHVLDVVKS